MATHDDGTTPVKIEALAAHERRALVRSLLTDDEVNALAASLEALYHESRSPTAPAHVDVLRKLLDAPDATTAAMVTRRHPATPPTDWRCPTCSTPRGTVMQGGAIVCINDHTSF